MFKCNDPLADLLKQYGYNLVAFPKPDIEPLELLEKNGNSLERIGQLKALFVKNDVAMPRKSADIPLAKELQNKKTAGINAKFGISILRNFLSAMNNAKVVKDVKDVKEEKAAKGEKEKEETKNNNLGGVFEHIDTFVFTYRDVLENKVDIIRLDEFIHDADLNEKAKSTLEKLKNSELYVIVSTVKSNSFETEFFDKKKMGVSVGLPDVKKIVEADISIEKDNETTNKLVYKCEVPLVFGFKAVRLIYEGNNRFKIKNADNVILRDEEEFPAEALQTEEAFIDL